MANFEKDSHPLIAAAAPQGPPGGGGGAPGGGAPGGGMPSGGGSMPGMMGGGPGSQRGGQAAPNFSEKLAKIALPSGPVTDKDMAGVKAVIDQICSEISTSIKSAGRKVNYDTIKSGLLGFQDWLKKQGCVAQASTRYAIESTDKYDAQIFETYPGTIGFDVAFKQTGNAKKLYRLLLFVTTADLFSFGSLEENRTTAGIPVPKGWPKNPWSYWTDRP